MSGFDRAIRWLQARAAGYGHGGKARVAEEARAKRPSFYPVLDERRTPNAPDFIEWLENLGWKLIPPNEDGETARPVELVNILKARDAEHLPDPLSDRYTAVPLASAPVAAGPGLLPEDGIKSWVILYSADPSIRGRSNLIAVEVGKGQTSGLPLIRPGDIVLIDKDDAYPREDGRYYLVRDPEEGAAIKRVKLDQARGRLQVIFYSENIQEYPPETYDVQKEFSGDLTKAIVGRVVWQWSDVTRR